MGKQNKRQLSAIIEGHPNFPIAMVASAIDRFHCRLAASRVGNSVPDLERWRR
jgi:hypothetical protein